MITDKVESCGTRIKKALSMRGMTQAELCRLSGVPKSPLSQYIKDTYEPREGRIRAMARVLDVDPLWLLGYDVAIDGTKNTPELTESERAWLELYRALSPEVSELFFPVLQEFDNLHKGERQMLLAMIGAAIKDKK